MNGLSFELAPPAPAPDPNRVDIACFVGYVARRATPLPAAVRAALAEARWTDGPYARPQPELEALLQLPVVVESWNAFDTLFAWDARPVGVGGRTCASYLGAAVRSFFANGGRRAVIVRSVVEIWRCVGWIQVSASAVKPSVPISFRVNSDVAGGLLTKLRPMADCLKWMRPVPIREMRLGVALGSEQRLGSH